MRRAAYEAWVFAGTEVDTRRFENLIEARTWASQYGEWMILERATMGWKAILHGGERGAIAAGAMA